MSSHFFSVALKIAPYGDVRTIESTEDTRGVDCKAHGT